MDKGCFCCYQGASSDLALLIHSQIKDNIHTTFTLIYGTAKNNYVGDCFTLIRCLLFNLLVSWIKFWVPIIIRAFHKVNTHTHHNTHIVFVDYSFNHSQMKDTTIHTYIVDSKSEGACVSRLRWGVRKSSQEVETGRTPASGCMVPCITPIWHSRVIVIPAEYHPGCVGLQKVRVCSM